MAADLHIHIFEGITKEDLKDFFSCTMGSKYFNPDCLAKSGNARIIHKKKLKIASEVMNTPMIWVGEVSWLKSQLTQDEDTYVPQTVAEIYKIIGEKLPEIDDELIDKIKEALGKPNTTGYKISSKKPIIMFLEKYRGKRVFMINW